MNQSGGVLSVNANNATIGSFGATGGAGGTVTTLQGAVVGGLSLGTVTISRGALIGNGAMGPFLPSSQGTTASSTSPGSMSVNSGRATATRFLSPQSAT